MTDTPTQLPTTGLEFVEVICYLAEIRPDGADPDADPDLFTIGGTVTLSVDTDQNLLIVRQGDDPARLTRVQDLLFTIQTSTGALIDSQGRVGFKIPRSDSTGIEPLDYTLSGEVRFTGDAQGKRVVFKAIPTQEDGKLNIVDTIGLGTMTAAGVSLLPQRVAALEAQSGGGPGTPSSGAYPVQQVALTGNLAYTLPADALTDQVVFVVFTQDGVGGRTVTYDGQPLTVDLAAGASTLVEFWPGDKITYPGSAPSGPAPDSLRKQHAAGVSNLASLIRKLDRGVSNAGILVISDSTGNQTNEWPYLVAQWLAGRYPAYTVLVRFWDETGELDYQAATTLQVGTGTRTLSVWIAGKAGGIPGYFLGARFDAAIRATSPDVVFLSHGHNMGDPLASESGRFGIRNGYLACTESVAKVHPFAAIVLLSQNPTTMAGRENWQAEKANILWEIAGNRDYGVIDVHEAFIQTPDWSTVLLSGDGVHPNEAGSQLWADTVIAAMEDARGATPARITPTPLVLPARNYIKNHDFSDWDGATPANWTVSAAASVEKDTTHYETGTQAAKVVGTATTGAAYIEAAVTGGDARELRGEWITVAVRVREPASNTQTVRVQVLDSTGTAKQRLTDTAQTAVDGFQWLFTNKRIDAGATGVYVRLNCRTTGAALVDATFDRVYLVKGLLPFAG